MEKLNILIIVNFTINLFLTCCLIGIFYLALKPKILVKKLMNMTSTTTDYSNDPLVETFKMDNANFTTNIGVNTPTEIDDAERILIFVPGGSFVHSDIDLAFTKKLPFVSYSFDYPVWPDVSVDDMVTSVKNAVAYIISLNQNKKITLIGHSAGAYLATACSSDITVNSQIDSVILFNGYFGSNSATSRVSYFFDKIYLKTRPLVTPAQKLIISSGKSDPLLPCTEWFASFSNITPQIYPGGHGMIYEDEPLEIIIPDVLNFINSL